MRTLKQQSFLCAFVLWFGLVTVVYAAQENDVFYTIVDANGRMITIPAVNPEDDKSTTKKPSTKTLNTNLSSIKQAKTHRSKDDTQHTSKKQLIDNKPLSSKRSTYKQSVNIQSAQASAELPKQHASTINPSAPKAKGFVLEVQDVTDKSEQAANTASENVANTKAEKQKAIFGLYSGTDQAKQIISKPVDGYVATEQSVKQKPKYNQPTSTQLATHQSTSQAQAKTQQLETQLRSQSKGDVLRFDDTEYVDSQVLVDKEFNLDEKERFYAVPDGHGGLTYVKRKSGVSVQSLAPKKLRPIFSISSDYERIDNSKLSAILPSQCLEKKHLEAATTLKSPQISLWPRPSKQLGIFKTAKVDADDFNAELIKLSSGTTHLSLLSFASSTTEQSYYWPLVVFLDDSGCALEAVGKFYQKKLPATWLQQSALKGNLVVPKLAAYAMLTPLEQSPDLPDTKLARQGALKITVLQ